MSKQQKTEQRFRTSGRERWAFAMFMAGEALFNQLFNAFGQKFMTDIGLAAATVGLIMFMLGWSGFKEGADAVQSQITLDTVWLLVSLMPAIGAVVSLVFFLRYRLRDKDVQLMAKVNVGDLSREEAQAQFSRQY
jgi:Na+/melibiose symporter-like transporter